MWEADPASSFFVAGNDLAELFSLVGVPSSAAPVELTEDGPPNYTPTALDAGSASLDVQQLTPGKPDASEFSVPATCTSGSSGPIAVNQAAPLSGAVNAGAAYSGQVAASAYTDLPATFATTTSSPGLTVSATGAVSAPASLAAGDYTASGTTSDGLGDTGNWTFTLTVQAGAPGAPTGVSASAGDGQATVSFAAPASNGGAAITSYSVMASAGGAQASGSASPITVTGLTDGTSYTFTVTATNGVGTGPASSASSAVTPVGVPGAPTGVSATAADGQAAVSFAAPASNGSAITSYAVTASPGGVQASGSASPITVTGLTDGTSYTFTVTATNGVGTGAASLASNTVTPKDTQAPTAPAGLTGRFSAGLLDLFWQASTDNVGVDHYELYLNTIPIERIAGTQTQASIRRFEPSGESVYTLRAFDAAGNESAVLASVTVERLARPATSPKEIPRWAWQLLSWQEHEHGKEPAHPKPLPDWYAAWKTWRLEPFKLVG